MIYVFEEGSVVYDETTITNAQKQNAVAVESLPIPEVIVGKKANVKSNLATQEVFYEYVDVIEEAL